MLGSITLHDISLLRKLADRKGRKSSQNSPIRFLQNAMCHVCGHPRHASIIRTLHSSMPKSFTWSPTDKGGMRRAYRASKHSKSAAMASPVSTERLASFHTLFVVLCGVPSRLNGSSRRASPCLGDMHIADCSHLPCSQRKRAAMRGSRPQTAQLTSRKRNRDHMRASLLRNKECCPSLSNLTRAFEGISCEYSQRCMYEMTFMMHSAGLYRALWQHVETLQGIVVFIESETSFAAHCGCTRCYSLSAPRRTTHGGGRRAAATARQEVR